VYNGSSKSQLHYLYTEAYILAVFLKMGRGIKEKGNKIKNERLKNKEEE
jgi:hypothetical protein